MFEDLKGRGGVAPGCERVDGGNGVVAIDLRQAGSANHGDMDGPWRSKEGQV